MNRERTARSPLRPAAALPRARSGHVAVFVAGLLATVLGFLPGLARAEAG